MKVFAKGCKSKWNKGRYGGKMVSFFVSIWLGKGICYCKHYEKLSGKLFAEFIEDNFFEVLKVAVTLQGMCLFKMVIQVKTPKLLKLL